MTQPTRLDRGRAAWQTQEQYENGLRYDAKRRAATRSLSTRIEVWRRCGDKNCQRSRACSGNDPLCLTNFLRSLPPDARLWLQKACNARRAGLRGEAVLRAANAAFIETVEREYARDAAAAMGKGR